MIKITRAAYGSTDVWLQMSEFGFGTYESFLATKPIVLEAIDGSRHEANAEGLIMLFDGNDNTKWGIDFQPSSNWGLDGNGAYAIFKTSRPIAPTYYKLVTGTDNEQYKHRNWKEFRIYATTETDESKLTRNSDAWILLDDKNVGEDVLPDKNSYSVFLTPSEQNTTQYIYFKVEIASLQPNADNGYMQMSELVLGDSEQLVYDRDIIYERLAAEVDVNQTFQTALKDEYHAMLETIKTTTDIDEVSKISNDMPSLKARISASIQAYKNLEATVESMRNHYESHTCISGNGRTVIGDYLNENIAPNDKYPNGSFPYIMANTLLDVDGINAEMNHVGAMLELYATDMTEGAITCSMHGVAGRNIQGMDNEGYSCLFDKDKETKWCTINLDEPLYVVFAADEPITPTYYKLTTGNDTKENPGRNWKNWKIYGANFDSEEAATKDAEGWTLIDEKTNIGTDQLPADNFKEAYFYLSKPSTTPYQYFKIEVESLMGGLVQQMADFEFGNDANRILLRNEKYIEMEAFDTGIMAYR
ncbi:MAG: hypothetical protein ACI4UA_08820, partial [Bacteroidaceae bacterium]